MRLTIRWRDGEHVAEATFDLEIEDGDVLDLTILPRLEPGNYVGDMETGQITATGRAN